MKYVDEFRDPDAARTVLARITARVTRPWQLMEVCGGQTHSIIKYGLDELLPDEITLIHGPGCPVCVTPQQTLDKAVAIALQQDVILCSFGDMLRVPGVNGSLLDARQQGADVRIVYSPMDALQLAQKNPQKQVVFLAIGFETTAPLNAMAVQQAARLQLDNFSVLVSQVTVPPAMQMVLSNADCQVDGFLAAGHVCTVMGIEEYQPLADAYQIPIVIAGFEPLDILLAVERCVEMLETGRSGVDNAYARSVRKQGNPHALACLQDVFELVDKQWRGLGVIPQSGLALKPAYHTFDAEQRFIIEPVQGSGCDACISGEILQGFSKPNQCPSFASACTPEKPLGATMVSEEGACHAYYLYRHAETEL